MRPDACRMYPLWHVPNLLLHLHPVQVPYYVTDEELTDVWECNNNIWDAPFSSCDVLQELSNDEIDQILALQVRRAGVTSCAAVHCSAACQHLVWTTAAQCLE